MQEKPDYIKCEYTELVSVQDIKPRENNPNKHNEAQINTLASLLMYQGIRKPLIISKLDGLLVTGHGTLEAIIKNGWGLVPVSYQDFESQEQAYAHCVADNAVARLSELDFSMINLELQNLGPDLNIDMIGIKDFKIDFSESDKNLNETTKELNPEKISTQFIVAVYCKNESQMQSMFEEFNSRGLECKLIT